MQLKIINKLNYFLNFNMRMQKYVPQKGASTHASTCLNNLFCGTDYINNKLYNLLIYYISF